jgi:hypothetical protein
MNKVGEVNVRNSQRKIAYCYTSLITDISQPFPCYDYRSQTDLLYLIHILHVWI